MTDKRIRPALPSAILLALLLTTASGLPSIAQSARSLVASGESPDLFLIYTGDVIGYVDPCG